MTSNTSLALDLPPFIDAGPYPFRPGSSDTDFEDDLTELEIDLLDLGEGGCVARIRYWRQTPEYIAQCEIDARFLSESPEMFATLRRMLRLLEAMPSHALTIELRDAELAAQASLACAEHGSELADSNFLPSPVPTRATPGPYAIGDGSEGVDDKLVVYSIQTQRDVAEILYWASEKDWSARSHARATFLAAAPYLHASLHAMVNAIGTLDSKLRTAELDALVQSATAILARAEGRA